MRHENSSVLITHSISKTEMNAGIA